MVSAHGRHLDDGTCRAIWPHRDGPGKSFPKAHTGDHARRTLALARTALLAAITGAGVLSTLAADL